jgi:hypothetical protein
MGRYDVTLTEEMVEDLPRRKLAYHKQALREFLRNPIRANKWRDKPEEEQWEAVRGATERRLKALFALYDIPDDWSNEIRWMQLAFCLAGESFVGCRTLSRGLGGPSAKTVQLKRARKEALLCAFDAYRPRHPKLTESACAQIFLSRHPDKCKQAGYTKTKSFVQGMRAIRRKTGTGTEAAES